MPADLFRHPLTALSGLPIDPASLRGKVVLIVNTASRCGFTPQLAGLEALWQRYRARGLVVLGFPCNQFAGQEPGTAADIGAFCRQHYGVSFPLSQRIAVNGANADPLWRELKQARPGLLGFGRIHWNFTKFLVDRSGRVVARFAPFTRPAQLAAPIEALL